MRGALLTPLVVWIATTALADIAPGSLRVTLTETDVELSWMTGTGPYSVYRSTEPGSVARPGNHLATTTAESYADPLSGVPGSSYYLVRDLVICAEDPDCDDGNPCTGFERCDAQANRCVAPPILERSLVDRPDDSPDAQLHMVYLLPADGTDQGLDTSGQLEAEVRVAQRWLEEQVGDCARFDTYQGSLDVTFARLSRTNEQIRTDPSFVDQTIRLELEGLGLDDPNKLNVVYYGGTNDENGCGGASAVAGGGPAVLFLVRRALLGELEPCPWFRFVSDADDVVRGPDGVRWAGVALHESFHALGMVPSCAPDHDDAHPAHLETISSDIMAFDGTGFDHYSLDEPRTEYYDHKNPDCLDLASSAVWYDAPPDPDPIPGNSGWVDPISIPCEDEPSSASAAGGATATIRIANTTDRTLKFYWLDFSGNRLPSETVPPYSEWCCGGTFEFHVFVATDADTGECLGLYEMVPGNNRVLITD